MYPKEIEELFKRYEHITKGSHFVKKEYLAGWSKDGKQVLTSIKGSAFSPNSLQDVCTKRYMYKMEKLTEIELLQLRYMYKDSPRIVQKVNDNFLTYWQLACSITDELRTPELAELANKMKIQVGENLQTNFERLLFY